MFQIVNNHIMLTNRCYRIFKALQLLIPAFATVYAIFSVSKDPLVLSGLALLTTLFTLSLNISARSYNASDKRYFGAIVIEEFDEDEGKKLFSLELFDEPDEIMKHKSILFKVIGKDSK